jgi:hypothetical protein
MEGTEGDYEKQSEIIWKNIMGILKELGVGLEAVVHRQVNFKFVSLPSSHLGNVPLVTEEIFLLLRGRVMMIYLRRCLQGI